MKKWFRLDVEDKSVTQVEKAKAIWSSWEIIIKNEDITDFKIYQFPIIIHFQFVKKVHRVFLSTRYKRCHAKYSNAGINISSGRCLSSVLTFFVPKSRNIFGRIRLVHAVICQTALWERRTERNMLEQDCRECRAWNISRWIAKIVTPVGRFFQQQVVRFFPNTRGTKIWCEFIARGRYHRPR